MTSESQAARRTWSGGSGAAIVKAATSDTCARMAIGTKCSRKSVSRLLDCVPWNESPIRVPISFRERRGDSASPS